MFHTFPKYDTLIRFSLFRFQNFILKICEIEDSRIYEKIYKIPYRHVHKVKNIMFVLADISR